MVRKSLLVGSWPRALLLLIGALAALHLMAAAGAVIFGITQMVDFWEVRGWLALFNNGGAGALNPYASASVLVDYPPYAFWLLAPLGWIPAASAFVVVPFLNLALAAAAAWSLARWFSELGDLRLTTRDTLVFMATVLATAAVAHAIVVGQTMPLSLLLLVTSLRLARRRPIVAGILFALGSYKLNVAAGFALALVVQGLFLPLVVAAIVVAVLVVLFSLQVGEPIAQLLIQYLDVLRRLYLSSASTMEEYTSIHGALRWFVSDPQTTGLAAIGLSLVLLAALLVFAWKHRHDASARPLLVAGALIWPLMAIGQAPYNLIVAMPAFWIAARSADRFWQKALVGLAFMYLVANISAPFQIFYVWVARHVAPGLAPDDAWQFMVGVEGFYRETMRLVVFNLFAALLMHLSKARSQKL